MWTGNTVLSAPLNISAFYLPGSTYFIQTQYQLGTEVAYAPKVPFLLYGYDWLDPATGLYPFRDMRSSTFTFSNQTYPLGHVLDYGRCQPTGAYQWGFSYIQLVVLNLFMLFWSVGIYLVYLKALFNLPLARYSEVPEGWECILHMARAMQDEFGAAGIETRGLTSRQLQDEAAQRFGCGTVSFGANNEEEHDVVIGLGMGVRGWLRIKKWWALAFTLQMAVWIVAVSLHTLWRGVPGLLAISYTACFIVYCTLLVKRTVLLKLIIPITWFAIGLEGLRVMTWRGQ